MSDQQNAQQKLQDRGIHEAAASAGWKYYNGGWTIPLYKPFGQRLQRLKRTAWKAYDSNTARKYIIPYKKDVCAIYALPGITEEIQLANGVLFIAGGFVNMVTFRAAEHRNAISFLTESGVPDDLPDLLDQWGVQPILALLGFPLTRKDARKKRIFSLSRSPITIKLYERPANRDSRIFARTNFRIEYREANVGNLICAKSGLKIEKPPNSCELAAAFPQVKWGMNPLVFTVMGTLYHKAMQRPIAHEDRSPTCSTSQVRKELYLLTGDLTS